MTLSQNQKCEILSWHVGDSQKFILILFQPYTSLEYPQPQFEIYSVVSGLYYHVIEYLLLVPCVQNA